MNDLNHSFEAPAPAKPEDFGRSASWHTTPKGDPRGYIQPQRLDELWFHTGTSCNLNCPFCFEGSKPGDERLQLLTLDDVEPLMLEALSLGARKFSFTGGEPFVNPHFPSILSRALELLPCLVLTNATVPLNDQLSHIEKLRDKPHPLSFRTSLDHPSPEKHDESRGEGNFKLALKTLGLLHNKGFGVSIARMMESGEDTAAVDAAYAPFFEMAGLPTDMHIVKFPDFAPLGSIPEVPQISTSCMTTYLTAEQREGFMCNFSKMVVKQAGRIGIYACTLVDDDPDFNLGSTLTDAINERVGLKHHRCYSCFAHGASCSEGV